MQNQPQSTMQHLTDPVGFIFSKASENDSKFVMLKAIIVALEETIIERREDGDTTKPSVNEYFAGIMTGLEAEDQSHTSELLDLLVLMLPSVHTSILRSKFTPITVLLMQLLQTNAQTDAPSVVRKLLASLGLLLKVQDPSTKAWNAPSLLKVLHAILSFFNDRRPKVRKAAHGAAVEVMKGSPGAGNQISDFSRRILEDTRASDTSPALHLLGFLGQALPYFPKAAALSVIEAILRLPSLGLPMLTQVSLQTLEETMASADMKLGPGGPELVRSFLDLEPNRTDRNGTKAFCKLMAAAMVKLKLADPPACDALLGQVVQTLVLCCEVDDGSVSGEAAFCLRKMLKVCVDVQLVSAHVSMKEGNKGQSSVLETVLASVEQLVQYRYQKAWTKTLPVLGLVCKAVGMEGADALKKILVSLGELHDALLSVPSAALPGVVAAVETAIGDAVEGVGCATVLEALPLVVTVNGQMKFNDKRVWLLNLLGKHLKNSTTSLKYFDTQIMNIAKLCDKNSKSNQVTPNEARLMKVRVVQLWELLPPFCENPQDVASHFGALAPKLANALQDRGYPQLCGIICSALQTLISGLRKKEEAGTDVTAMLQVVASTSIKFLPILFGALDNWGYQDSGQASAISVTVALYAKLAPEDFLRNLFKKLVQRLLQATQSEPNEEKMETSTTATKAIVLCELAHSLVPSLDAASIALLTRVINPLVRADKDPHLQKRAYKVLLAVCEHHPSALLSPEKLSETMEIIATTLVTSHVNTRTSRLKCLALLAKEFDCPGNQQHRDCLISLTGEVILCLKDSNAKARAAAYEALLALSKASQDPGEFTNIVLGGLAAKTPHMRSAAVLALARILYEYGSTEEKIGAMIPALLTTVMLCLREKANESIKAAISFCRVAVACAPAEALDPMLPDILENLMGGAGKQAKFKFRAKIKLIITKLCRKLGFERVLECIPEGDQKLVAHIKKMHERDQKKKHDKRDRHKQKIQQVKSFEDMMNSDEESEDEDGAAMRKITSSKSRGNTKKGDYMMRDVGDDEEGALDLLDSTMVKNMKVMGVKEKKDIMMTDDNDNEEIKVAEDGRLIIPDSEGSDDDEKPLFFLEDDEDQQKSKKKKKRIRENDEGVNKDIKPKAQGKKLKTQSDPGAKFKAKKAGGDVRKKGEVEPYAYIPLDGRMLSKKKSKTATDRYRSVVVQGRNKSLKGLKKRKGGRK